MTISETKRMLEGYTAVLPSPTDFEAFWRERVERVKTTPSNLTFTQVAFQNSAALYYELSFTGVDGTALSARYICPVADCTAPLVLTFHDDNRSIRGWHHMTRFLALGYAVIALKNRACITEAAGNACATLESLYTDALTLAFAAQRLPRTSRKQMITWGEGLGGGLALCVAAMMPNGVAKCAVLNPMPADFGVVNAQEQKGIWAGALNCVGEQNTQTTKCAYLDCVNFAPLLGGELLMGTSGMDEYAPPAAQYAVYNRAVCKKRHLFYPKYIHERINYFEDELTKFLHF